MQTSTCGYMLIALFSAAQASNFIANDVVNDYALVRELLGQYYQRSARRIGHDYDPDAVQKQAEADTHSDGTEATINKKIWTEVFENDIILTLDQAEHLLKEQPHARGKRQAEPNPNKFWSNLTISYEFGTKDANWQNLIRQAIRHVESQTCMRFRENGKDRNRLLYIRGNGCWSNVGMIGGRQQVSIGYGCEYMGIISHETCHALGLWHEQSRNDRDDYVSLRTQYIMRGTIGNFEKRTPATSDNLQQPYDLGSVMHYGPKAFTTDWGENTIATRDSNYQNTIGQREGMSFKDAKMINTRYCQNVCSVKLACQNEGYTDPNDCSKCRCPAGYGGKLCQNVAYVTGSPGGELTAYDSWYRIISPELRSNIDITYRIRAEQGQRIEMVFDEVSFLCRDTCKSFIEVKYKKSKTHVGARLCCKKPSSTVVSEDNEVVLIYKGESDLPEGYRGFTIRYRIYGSSSSSQVTDAKPQPPNANQPDRIITETTATTPTSPTWSTTVPTSTNIGSWGEWGSWSQCSHACGGCGTRLRVRACYGGTRQCPGNFQEEEHCNIYECRYPKKATTPSPKSSDTCVGRIVLPCSLMEKLYFGQRQRDVKRVKRSLDSVDDANSCEKSFKYACPTGLLSIHLDWRNQDDPQADPPACCEGFYPSGGNCYPYRG